MAPITRRTAFRKWQSSHKKLQAALEELNHQYLALLNNVAMFPIDQKQGLLHQASSRLLHPLDAETLQLHERLAHAFDFLGTGFCRRSPTALQLDTLQYADRIQEICQELDRLSQKLSLARKIIDILLRNQKTSRHYFDLTLFDPEGVWMTLLLEERCRLTSRVLELSFEKSCRAKLAACQKWVKLLQSSLPSEKLEDLKRIMPAIPPQKDDTPAAIPGSTLHQLDRCLDLAHRLSFEALALRPDKISPN